MLSDENLLFLNKQGLFPGPGETADLFERRLSLYKEFSLDPAGFFRKRVETPPFPLDTYKTVTLNISQYGIEQSSFLVFYSNKGLSLLEGGLTTIVEIDGIDLPLIQINQNFLKKERLWGIYSKQDVIEHETLHAMRASFEETRFEEFFPYKLSKHPLRRILGPIICKKEEGHLFLALVFAGTVFSLLSFLWASILAFLASFVLLALGVVRLSASANVLKKAEKHLKELKIDPLPFLFRLTDAEIEKIAQISGKELLKYIEEQKSYRWSLLKGFAM